MTMESLDEIIKEASLLAKELRDAMQLPASRCESVEELLWDWAENHNDLSIGAVILELKRLFREQEAEEQRKQAASGNE